MWAFVLAYGIRFESGLIPVTQGLSAARAVPQRAAVRRRADAARVPAPGRLPPAPRPLARRRLLRGAHRQHPRGRLRRRLDALRAGLLRLRRSAKARGAYQVSQLVWALFLVLNVVFTYASREAVRELLERRWRAGIGLKRILIAGAGDLGPHGGRPHPAAPRARLPGGRLRGRPRRRRPHRLPRPAAARHAGRGRRDRPARAHRSPLRRAAARGARRSCST